ncbi:LytTR family transcriptional regulator DNA-binding domain-containing protein [Croceimicrobium sp.]|uniref:LytTR family transcriptional regulator DNA-binding domain-containing protein n=1 Tax=Croceimicrobium sp. TaxID=2828340 RepID=UPI003BABF936
MKRLLGAMLGLLMTYGAYAQEGKEKWVEASLQDIRNPKVLDSIAQGLLQYADDSVALGRAYFLKGLAGTFSANPTEAARNFKKSLSHLEEGEHYDDRFSYEVVLKNLGISFYRIHEFERGDSSFRILRRLAMEDQDSLQYAVAIKNMANALMMRESYDSAAILMKETAIIQQRIDYQGIALTYLSLGSLYGRIHQEEEALRWFHKALKNSDKVADRRLEARAYNNLAVAHRALSNYDSAIYYLEKALQIQRTLGSKFDQIEVLANISRNFSKLAAWDSAKVYLDRAYSLMPPRGQRQGRSLQNLWMLSLKMANNQNDYEAGAPYFDSIRSSPRQDYFLNDPEYLEAFAHHLELKGEADSALKYLRLSKQKQAELDQKRDAAKIKQASNEIEMAALRGEQEEKVRSYKMALMVILIFLILGSLIFWISRRKVKQIKSEREAEAARLSAEVLTNSTKLEASGFSLIDEHQAPEPELPSQLRLKSKAVIKIEDLIYLESDGHYVNLFLKYRKNPEVERSTLKAMEEQLSGHDFIRIHRSYLVQASFLKAVYATKVLLEDGRELPVSRTYKEDLKKRFEGEV